MDYSGRKPKVLIVDDQTDLTALYQRKFVRDGFEVKVANDGDSGLAAAREFRPDAILLDLMMPGLSGFDALDLFRDILETSDSKIIVLSALGGSEDIEKAKQWGADDYIIKSDTTMEDVVVRVKQVLGLPVGQSQSGEAPAAEG